MESAHWFGKYLEGKIYRFYKIGNGIFLWKKYINKQYIYALYSLKYKYTKKKASTWYYSFYENV